jgi:hypothetical protein
MHWSLRMSHIMPPSAAVLIELDQVPVIQAVSGMVW